MNDGHRSLACSLLRWPPLQVHSTPVQSSRFDSTSTFVDPPPVKPAMKSSVTPNRLSSTQPLDRNADPLKARGDARSAASRNAALLLSGGLMLLGVLPAQAAEVAETASATEIQAELDRVQAEADRLKQLLADRRKAPGDAAAEPAADATATAEAGADQAAELDTVVIRSGGRKLERVKDIPQSISIVSGDDLRALGADSLRDITRRAANISRPNGSNARNQNLVVRGIGRRGTTEAQDPQVGVNIDGVPYAYPGLAAWDFVDVDTVEVARGPQGTAGGHNPSYGLLTLTTKRPSFTRSSDFLLRVGQRNAVFGSAALGGGIIDDVLAWRGTFYVNKFEGPYGNAYWSTGQRSGDQTYTDRLKISGKTQFLLKPTDNYSVLASVDIQPRSYQNDNGLNFFHALPEFFSDGVTPTTSLQTSAQFRLARRWFASKPGYTFADNYANFDTGLQNNDQQLPLITGTNGAALTQTLTINDSLNLTSISAYRNLYFNARNDEGTPFDISLQGGGGVRYKQFTQELRLAGAIPDFVDFRTGLFYIRNNYAVDSRAGWGSDAGAWFASNPQYNALDADAPGRFLMSQSLDGLRRLSTVFIDNRSPAIFGNANWVITDKVSLNIGIRVTREDRTSSTFARIDDNGFGGELNPSISSFGVELGGFDSFFNNGTAAVNVRDGFVIRNGSTDGATSVAAGTVALTTDSRDPERNASALAAANAAAFKYFRTASWDALTDPQKRQLAQAQAIRKTQIGQIFDPIQAESFRKTQLNWTVSPSYRWNDQVTNYFSFQHGEKPGIAQVINGNSLPAGPEVSNNFELGVKTSTFGRTLTVNADVFLSRLANFQQTSLVFDEFTTNLNNNGELFFTQAAANVPKVQIHGLELDGAYSGIRNVTFTLSGAYNVARYKSFANSPQPPENQIPAGTNLDGTPRAAAPPSRDVSGRILPGAAKYTANLGAQYRYPAFGDKLFHVDANINYTSRYNSDIALSSYGVISDYSITDFAIGLGKANGAFDASLLVKNLFDAEGKAFGFTGGTLDTTPRWVYLQFTARL
ncbi:MAG: TonB-dependent receptor [Xanthomonadaceae bacterium]|nr:TonB-dependent receptor [Xanthomonadaceae bacterium]